MDTKKKDFWNTPLTRSLVRSDEVKLPEMLFGYFIGPFGALLSSGIFTSMLQQYFADVLKLNLSFLTALQLVSTVLIVAANLIVGQLIERTKVLVYVLDMAGTDGRDPVEDFRHLQNELELYQSGLTRRPSLIAANKMDAPEAAENLRRLEAVVAGKYGIIPVTAAVGELGNLKQAFKTLVSGS